MTSLVEEWTSVGNWWNDTDRLSRNFRRQARPCVVPEHRNLQLHLCKTLKTRCLPTYTASQPLTLVSCLFLHVLQFPVGWASQAIHCRVCRAHSRRGYFLSFPRFDSDHHHDRVSEPGEWNDPPWARRQRFYPKCGLSAELDSGVFQ